MEENIIKKIETKIRMIRSGILTPETAKLGFLFKQLKPLNIGMYEELLNNYRAVILKVVV